MQGSERETVGVLDAVMGPETLEAFRRLIAAAYYENAAALDVRHLWSRGGGHYFRVNWRHVGGRHDGGIYRSAFVAIDESSGAPVITDLTAGRAA